MPIKILSSKKKHTRHQIKGNIVSANENCVSVQILGDITPYRRGRRVAVSIPQERKTAAGKVVKVADIIAHGEITSVEQNTLTISSMKNNPIISKSALNKSTGLESLMYIESID